MSLVIFDAAADVAARTRDKRPCAREASGTASAGTGAAAWCHGLSSDPLAHVQLLLVHQILSARKSMLLKVPLSVHEEMVHAQELLGEAAHDHEHV